MQAAAIMFVSSDVLAPDLTCSHSFEVLPAPFSNIMQQLLVDEAAGDLAKKKTFPSIFQLQSPQWSLVGLHLFRKGCFEPMASFCARHISLYLYVWMGCCGGGHVTFVIHYDKVIKSLCQTTSLGSSDSSQRACLAKALKPSAAEQHLSRGLLGSQATAHKPQVFMFSEIQKISWQTCMKHFSGSVGCGRSQVDRGEGFWHLAISVTTSKGWMNGTLQ